MIILIFGDSITYGCWDEEGGWVSRLKKFLDKKSVSSNFEKITGVYNLGIDGETSDGILRRFDAEVGPRLWPGDKIAIIFALGINESQFLNEKKEFFVPPDKFKANIRRLTKKAEKYSSKIIFLGLTPVDDSKVDPCPWVPERSYRNENVRKYNQIIKEECLKNKVDFVEIFEKFIEKDYEKLLIDGAHPNTEGHKVIFEIIKEFLVHKGII